jgi:hypothetical protein
MGWFKKQTPVIGGDIPSELLALVRTMEDDLSGRSPVAERPKKQEPPVSFRPGATAGAPFFAAPGVAEPAVSPEASPRSPFFAVPESEASEAPILEIIPSAPAGLPVIDEPQPPRPVRPSTGGAAQNHSPLPSTPAPPTTTTPPFIAESPRREIVFREAGTPAADVSDEVPPKNRRKWLIIGLVSVFLLLVGAGLLYWFFLRTESVAPKENPQPEAPSSPTASLSGSPVPAPGTYSLDQPNFLSFNTETVTADEIKTGLLQAAQSIRTSALPGTVEFLVRDQNLNPLAFSRFAYLMKLSVPENLLRTLDESFSLYIFIDDGRPRAALMLRIRDEAAFADEIGKSERSLGLAFEPLFLDTTTAPKGNLIFRSSNYLERPVRYANIDAGMNLSIDHAVRGKNWVVGTSKDALRAVLDRHSL